MIIGESHLIGQKAIRISDQKQDAMTSIKPIPDGYHTVTPYLLVQGADKLIDRKSVV